MGILVGFGEAIEKTIYPTYASPLAREGMSGEINRDLIPNAPWEGHREPTRKP